MKSFEKAIENLMSASVITMKKHHLTYDGYLLKYDGNIFKDTSLIELGALLEQFPNIKNELDNGYTYYGLYDFEKDEYQSTIIIPGIKRKGRTVIQEEILDDYQVFHKDFISSIIELDTKIASQNLEPKQEHQKKLVS